jgi:hypothetical protein
MSLLYFQKSLLKIGSYMLLAHIFSSEWQHLFYSWPRWQAEGVINIIMYSCIYATAWRGLLFGHPVQCMVPIFIRTTKFRLSNVGGCILKCFRLLIWWQSTDWRAIAINWAFVTVLVLLCCHVSTWPVAIFRILKSRSWTLAQAEVW